MKKSVFLLLMALAFIQVNAQKLPAVQTASLLAPANIKIDGRANEWNNTYQAYNPATEIFYTISNDDKNLYLITYVDWGQVLIHKVLKGGINFQINTNNHKLNFCYPAFNDPPPKITSGQGGVKSLTGKEDHPTVVKNNTIFANSAKVIEITGISGITGLIPIYNEHSIIVAGRFDAKLGYVYELAIPLKYLDTTADNPQSIEYKVSIKGKYMKPLPQIIGITRADGTNNTNPADLAALQVQMERASAAQNAETNFTGKYTLAK